MPNRFTGKGKTGKINAATRAMAAGPQLLEALRGMLTDYRTEGCADPACLVCAASKAAKSEAQDAIAAATKD